MEANTRIGLHIWVGLSPRSNSSLGCGREGPQWVDSRYRIAARKPTLAQRTLYLVEIGLDRRNLEKRDRVQEFRAGRGREDGSQFS